MLSDVDPIAFQLEQRLKRVEQIREDADLTGYEADFVIGLARECAALKRLIAEEVRTHRHLYLYSMPVISDVQFDRLRDAADGKDVL